MNEIEKEALEEALKVFEKIKSKERLNNDDISLFYTHLRHLNGLYALWGSEEIKKAVEDFINFAKDHRWDVSADESLFVIAKEKYKNGN